MADITYVAAGEGWLYLAAVLDCFSRRVVGWSMADHLRTELVTAATSMALQRRCPRYGQLTHHSDHGCQYTSLAFGQQLRDAGVTPSMGSVGDAYDNAVAESFFATLKVELLYRHDWPTRAAARSAIFRYIETWYNLRRRHSTLGYTSPAAVAACGQGKDATGSVATVGPVTLQLWTNGDEALGYAKEYEQRTPNVRFEGTKVGDYGVVAEKALANVAASTPPHVSILGQRNGFTQLAAAHSRGHRPAAHQAGARPDDPRVERVWLRVAGTGSRAPHRVALNGGELGTLGFLESFNTQQGLPVPAAHWPRLRQENELRIDPAAAEGRCLGGFAIEVTLADGRVARTAPLQEWYATSDEWDGWRWATPGLRRVGPLEPIRILLCF